MSPPATAREGERENYSPYTTRTPGAAARVYVYGCVCTRHLVRAACIHVYVLARRVPRIHIYTHPYTYISTLYVYIHAYLYIRATEELRAALLESIEYIWLLRESAMRAHMCVYGVTRVGRGWGMGCEQ